MNVLRSLLQSSDIARLGWALVHSLWEGAAVAALLAIALMLLRNRAAQTRYIAGCTAMGAMILLPAITFVALRSAVEKPSSAKAPAILPATPSMLVSAGRVFTTSGTLNADAPASTELPVENPNVEASRAAAVATQTPAPPKPAELKTRDFLPRVVMAWAAGVVVLSIWNLGGWLALRRLTSARIKPVGQEVRDKVAQLCAKLKLSSHVRLLESAVAGSPLVIGVFRPIILVPASVLCELPAAQLESILAHELAHIRRHDYLVNLIQSAIETLLFYHPAVWWISRRVRAERENCCDDIALGVTSDRAEYARALAAVAAVRAPALAPAASGGILLARVRRVMGLPETETRRSGKWAAGIAGLGVCLLAAALAIVPVARGRAEPLAPPATQPTTRPAQENPAPAKEWIGRLVTPDGLPLVGATILIVRARDQVVIRDGAVEQSSQFVEFGSSNKAGEFTLSPEKESFHLFILHDRGFADLAGPGPFPSRIVVQPWGTIEGTAFIGSKPAEGKTAEARVFNYPSRERGLTDICATGLIDSNGHFVIRHVAPARNQVGMRLIVPHGKEMMSEWLNQSVYITVAAGDRARVALGGKGRPVVGRIFMPPNIGQNIDWRSVECTIATKLHPPVRKLPANWKELSVAERTAINERWKQTPEAQRYRKEVEDMRSFPVVVGMFEMFRAEDIPAGEYELRTQVWPSTGAFAPVGTEHEYRPMAMATIDLTVPAMPGGRSDEALDLGAVQLKTIERKDQPRGEAKIELTGVVRQPDGRPAAGATVAIIPDGMELNLPVTGGKFLSWSPQATRTITDDKGVYHLTASTEHFTLGIFHESGYAQIPYYDRADRPEFKLTAWAHAKGVLREGEQPISGVTVLANGTAVSPQGGGRLYYSSETTTAADGAFAFDFLPARSEISIGRNVERPAPNEPATAQLHLAYVTIEPGKTATVSPGTDGRRVTGRVRLAKDVADAQWTADARIIPDVVRNGDGPPTSWYAMSSGGRRAWYESQLSQSPLRGKSYPVTVGRDGSFQAENIPSGYYVLLFDLSSPRESGRRESLMSFNYAFTIDDAAGGHQNPVQLPDLNSDGEPIYPSGDQAHPATKAGAIDAPSIVPFRGFAFVVRHIDDPKPYLKAIDDVADLGADTVSLVVESKQENMQSTRIFLDARDLPTDVQLTQIIARAHQRKLRVVLMPIVLLAARKGENDWRGNIQPDVWEDWWDSYREMIHHFASQAEASGVDLFVVGSELVSTEHAIEQWTRTISQVRKDFHGQITYCANWDHYSMVPFWGQLDVIGMSCYYRIGDTADLTIDQIKKRWEGIQKSILATGKHEHRPVVMLEVGWPSMANAISEPWDYTRRDVATNADLQARLYEGFFESWWGKPGFGGFVMWSWTPGDHAGGPDDRSYTPQGKPAEAVVRAWLAKPWKE